MMTSPSHRRVLTCGILAALVLVPSLTIAAGSLARPTVASRTFSRPQPLSVGPRQGVPVSTDLLYISNTANNSIRIYRHDASGNTPPIAVIAGPKTGLNAPNQLSEDAQGNLYVLNAPYTSPSVLVFAHGAVGNVAPIRKLAGPHAGLHLAGGMTLDQNTGKLFITDINPTNNGSYEASLLRFPPGATGDTAPFARSMSTFVGASQLANDSTGNNVIEAHGCGFDNCNLAGVNTFTKQFPNGAEASLVYSIQWLVTSGVADDPATKTYLVSSSEGIYRLAEVTSGDGPEGNGGATRGLRPLPLALITSAKNCGQLALGYLRNIFAVCGSSIEVFTPNASGNATPLRVLSGARTGLNSPVGIYEGK